jgi:glycolate oxidase iron-sulfur subunit
MTGGEEDVLRQELYGKVKALIGKCNRCGFCRAVCPSLNELGWESSSPRGRIFLAGQVLSGKMELTIDVVARLDQCLLCRNCMTVCPVGARIDQIIMALRRLTAEELGTAKGKKVILSALADHRNLFSSFGSVARWLEHIPYKERVSNGAVFRLRKKVRVLPMIGGKPLLDQLRSVELEKPLKKVVFFAGCYINFIGTNIGRSVINVLARNGCSVYLPPAQVCCGVPFFASGEIDRAVGMVRQNVDILSQSDADAIVYACGSCGTGLREWASHPEVGAEYIDKAQGLKKKIFEIGEFLIDQLGITRLPALPKSKRITYHDSCHLAYAGIKEQPRRLLQMIGNAEYVEMPDAATCCGCGGLFSVTHYKLSRQINARKIKNILKVEPQIVTSGCPGCNLHIMDGLNKADNEASVYHYIELINNAYECSAGADV